METQEKRVEALSLSIGARIRAMRRQRQYTLQQLADRSGLSTPYISNIESGKATPSLTALLLIADALDEKLDTLIQIPRGDSLVKRADEPEIVDTGSEIVHARLSNNLPHRSFDAATAVFPPNFTFSEYWESEGEKLVYILEGELYYEYGDEKYTLGPGDCIHYDFETRHTVANLSDQETKVLWVSVPPIFDGLFPGNEKGNKRKKPKVTESRTKVKRTRSATKRSSKKKQG